MKLIAIHSMPRSGSTWLGSIIDSSRNVSYKMQPLFSYELKGFLSDQSNLKEIKLFKDRLLKTDSDFMDQIEKKKLGIVPSFQKDTLLAVAYKETRYHHILGNLLEKDDQCILVGIIRNPLAHLYSWLNAPKEFRADLGWEFEEEWRYAQKKNEGRVEEFYGYEKWKVVAYLFQELEKKFSKRVLLISYTNLLRDVQGTVDKLFDFLNLPLDKQTMNFITNSRIRNIEDPYGVYKTRVNDSAWKDKLPDYIVDFVKRDLKDTNLEKYLTD